MENPGDGVPPDNLDCLTLNTEVVSREAPNSSTLKMSVQAWCRQLKAAADLVDKRSSSKEPFKNIYKSIEDIKILRKEVQDYMEMLKLESTSNPMLTFWVKFTLIHIYSCIAKWSEACDELSQAEDEHKICILLIEQTMSVEDEVRREEEAAEDYQEFEYGILRCRYMLIYELTRYAILCSERDDQEKALSLLKRAEEFYHTHSAQDIEIPSGYGPLLNELDSLNPQKSYEMFTYVLFYLGQAYRITGEKERAILYLHMVLRRQLEKEDYSKLTWSADSARMASVVVINMQSFEAARNMLVAATVVLNTVTEEEKLKDDFKQALADLGKAWVKLGIELLEASCDRLKDLEEQTKKPPKFSDCLKLSQFEKMSLDLDLNKNEFDTMLLIKLLSFPSIDISSAHKEEMPGRYARDFEEARAIFLPLQRWFRASKDYYVIDEYAGDYIELVTDYCNSFKYLVFFEPDIERQIKMERRRIGILEELLSALSPTAYHEVFHHSLRELAVIYENVYKLKVSKAKERGESLRPKDRKLVKLLSDAMGAHRRNLENFVFDINNAEKDFPEEYEKTLLGAVISIGRILGSISHDHPLHPEAIAFAEEGKLFYKFFLSYLDRRPNLKEEFKVLYDGSIDLPDLLDMQIEKLRDRLRRLAVG